MTRHDSQLTTSALRNNRSINQSINQSFWCG